MNNIKDIKLKQLTYIGIRLVREEKKPIDKVLNGDFIIQEICYNCYLTEQEAKKYCDFYLDNQAEINCRINQWYNPK
jgi:hypothetical protein